MVQRTYDADTLGERGSGRSEDDRIGRTAPDPSGATRQQPVFKRHVRILPALDSDARPAIQLQPLGAFTGGQHSQASGPPPG